MRVAIVFLIVALSGTAGGCGQRELVPERIPGTERYWPESPARISLSPDEKYLVFPEVDSAYAEPPAAYEVGAPDFHFVTLNLGSGRSTHHVLGNLPRLSKDIRRPHGYLLGFFEPAGWDLQSFYIRYRTEGGLLSWIALRDGIPQVANVGRPATLTCSDCSPPGLARKLANERHIDGVRRIFDADHFTTPAASGDSPALYTDVDDGSKLKIIRIDNNRRANIVVTVSKLGHNMEGYHVRVSPNERYLAYAVEAKLNIPIPHRGDGLLYIRDLKRRKTFAIAGVYVEISNLVWSPDSERLYYGASGLDAHGVYVVRMPD